MTTPVETPPPPAGDPVEPTPATEPAEPTGGAPDPHESPELDPQGLPQVLPDGVQVSGRSGGQPETPAEPPKPPAQQTPPSPTPAEPGQPPAARPEITDLPDWAQDLIKETRAEAARNRVEGKNAAADEARKQLVQDLGKALGLVNDEAPTEDPLTPEQLQEMLSGERISTRMARTELAVFKAATGGKFNAPALLDSRSFLDSVKDLDPSDSEAMNAAIAAAVEANPWLVSGQPAATPPQPDGQPQLPSVPVPPPSGGSFAGGPGGRPQDMSSMSIDDFRKMRRDNTR